MSRLLSCVLVLLALSCIDKKEYISMSSSSSNATFTFMSVAKSSASTIYIIVRHTEDFKYKHIPMIVKTTIDNKYTTSDTILYNLYSNLSWLGKSIGSRYSEAETLYRDNVVFKPSSIVEISITPLLDKRDVEELEYIGLRVSNAEPLLNNNIKGDGQK